MKKNPEVDGEGKIWGKRREIKVQTREVGAGREDCLSGKTQIVQD